MNPEQVLVSFSSTPSGCHIMYEHALDPLTTAEMVCIEKTKQCNAVYGSIRGMHCMSGDALAIAYKALELFIGSRLWYTWSAAKTTLLVIDLPRRIYDERLSVLMAELGSMLRFQYESANPDLKPRILTEIVD